MKTVMILLMCIFSTYAFAQQPSCITEIADNGIDFNVVSEGKSIGVISPKHDGSWDMWINGIGGLNDIVYTETEAANLVCNFKN